MLWYFGNDLQRGIIGYIPRCRISKIGSVWEQFYNIEVYTDIVLVCDARSVVGC